LNIQAVVDEIKDRRLIMSDLENLRKILVLLETANEYIFELSRDLSQSLEFDSELSSLISRVKRHLAAIEKNRLYIMMTDSDVDNPRRNP
jgi:hypothetical protein